MTNSQTRKIARRSTFPLFAEYVVGYLLITSTTAAPPSLKKNMQRDVASSGSRAWLSLPPTPLLPKPKKIGLAPVNGVNNFYAQFGSGPNLVFLHGGLANSSYWGYQIASLSSDFTVTVMDTRGHGRSPLSSNSFGYRIFADDVAQLLKHLGIEQAKIVGWSDGAVTGLQFALIYPHLITGLFAFGANSSLGGIKIGGSHTPVFTKFTERARQEYLALSPTPEKWQTLTNGLAGMWHTPLDFISEQIGSMNLPVMIADGDHDEIIKRSHTEQLARAIPGSKLSILSNVSHFAMLQNPGQFTDTLRDFLLHS